MCGSEGEDTKRRVTYGHMGRKWPVSELVVETLVVTSTTTRNYALNAFADCYISGDVLPLSRFRACKKFWAMIRITIS